ncbi:NAD(P)-binding protein-28 [Coleophoma crateriformis]|uniref:NAD(P)-binding protein-28 n=1 Tax=Coleophoma crateriformis TaxID=565419 RepID=A0A3D8QZ77_9HELO|nr:NAD(P)-binding protein-28 [Coleophoma crateriformis]
MASFPSYTSTWHSSTYATISPTRPELSLHGKSVVITGGGSGIGAAITEAFARAGVSKLAIIGRRKEVLEAAAARIKSIAHPGTQIIIVVADVASQEQVTTAFDKIAQQFDQKPDILVSNAGYFGGRVPLDIENLKGVDATLNINVKGAFLVTKAFISIAVDDATIINISSAVEHLPPWPGFALYAASKAAAHKLMESFQLEYPSLHVVSLHPGQVMETDMSAKLKGLPDHIDDAELAGHFSVWLASSEASFLKGKYVWANWDADELISKAAEIQASPILTLALEGFSSFKPLM